MIKTSSTNSNTSSNSQTTARANEEEEEQSRVFKLLFHGSSDHTTLIRCLCVFFSFFCLAGQIMLIYDKMFGLHTLWLPHGAQTDFTLKDCRRRVGS